MNSNQERANRYMPIIEQHWEPLAKRAWFLYQRVGLCTIVFREADIAADRWDTYGVAYQVPGGPPIVPYNPHTHIQVALRSETVGENDLILTIGAQGQAPPPPEC